MPYFEPLLDQSDTAEIINLKRILELCHIPDVGRSPLDPQITSETRCTNALTTLEKTTSVFDDAFYQDAVFMEEMDEDILESELWEQAKLKGVPKEHFPDQMCITSPPCPSAPKIRSVLPKSFSDLPVINEPLDQIQEDTVSIIPAPSPRATPRPSISLSFPFRKSTRSLNLQTRPSSPSNASFISSFSKQSSVNPLRRTARGSIFSLFRRDSKRSIRPEPLDETRSWTSNPPAENDVPSLQSARTHSQISSSPSISASSRTSSSSFADLSLFAFDGRGRFLQKSVKSPKFITLRARCVNEAKRFIDFAQHQRVALPLFLGRSRMYLDGRMKTRLEQLEKQVGFPSSDNLSN
jgi:hypothetical protein